MHYLCFYLLDLGWTMKEVSGTEYYAVLELPNVRESHAIYVLRDRKYTG